MNDKDILDAQIEAWKEIVTTQRHFNDVCMKVRHLGFVLVAALVGASGFTMRSGYEIALFSSGYTVPVASVLLLFGAVFWVAIWFLDVKWYTPFLVGSVKAGLKVESEINQRMTEIQLTQFIKSESGDSSIFGIPLSSSKRAPIFHLFMVLLLLSMSILLAFFDNSSAVELESESTPNASLVTEKQTTGK